MLSNAQFKKLLDNSTLKKPFLVGKRGEGKTQFLKDYCATEMLNLCIINLSCIDAADFSGMPYIENGQTKYARPFFFDCDVLFFDEMDRVQDQQVKSTLLSFLIDGKINGHEFKGKVVGAGNGTKEGTNETSDFDDAMSDRLLFVPFKYTEAEKINYLEKKFGSDNTFMKYVKAKDSIFDDFSTRTIEYCMGFHDDIYILSLAIGKSTATHYEQFVNNLVMTVTDIVNGKDYSKLNSMSKISLSHDIAANIYKFLELGKKEIKHLNGFINSLAAEEKSSYFLQLQGKASADPNFRDVAKKLNSMGFFDEQRDFLRELGD